MFKNLVSGAKKLAYGPSAAPDLFPKVSPDVDGEDCLHNCASCSIQYPRNFKIEENDELYGHVKGWATHVLVATGKSDWVRDVADEKGSVMEALDRAQKPSNGVSNTLSTLNHVFSFLFLWYCVSACARRNKAPRELMRLVL